jgi:hypothetical protein
MVWKRSWEFLTPRGFGVAGNAKPFQLIDESTRLIGGAGATLLANHEGIIVFELHTTT